jgi:hypothetical protein
MSPDEKDFGVSPQIDWGNFKYWRVWDPIPYWILDKDKIEQIMVVQFESRIMQMKGEIEQMNKIVEIIRRK